jgi:hypothetical protein
MFHLDILQLFFGSRQVRMTPALPPAQPEGSSPFERLDRGFRAVLKASKADLLKEEAKLKAQRDKRRETKKPS